MFNTPSPNKFSFKDTDVLSLLYLAQVPQPNNNLKWRNHDIL